MQKQADIDIPRLDIEEEVKRLEQAANQFAMNKGDDKQVLGRLQFQQINVCFVKVEMQIFWKLLDFRYVFICFC